MESKFYVRADYPSGAVFDNGMSYKSREECIKFIEGANELIGEQPVRVDITEVMFDYGYATRGI